MRAFNWARNASTASARGLISLSASFKIASSLRGISAPPPLAALGRHVGDLALGRINDARDQRRQRLEGVRHFRQKRVLVICRTNAGHGVTEASLGHVTVNAGTGQEAAR